RMAVALLPVGLRHRSDLPKVLVGDLFLRIRQLEEALPRRVILAVRERDAEPAEAVVEGVATGARGEHDARVGETYVLRLHDLVVQAVLQHAVLVDTGRMGEGVGPRSEEHTSELQSRGHLVCRL